MKSEFEILSSGEAAVLVKLGEQIDMSLNQQVHRLDQKFIQAPLVGIVEIVPAYASLLIHYDPTVLSEPVVIAWIERCACRMDEGLLAEPRLVEIPIFYGGVNGPDLESLARAHELSVEEVIRLHSQAIYTVYMTGFTPGFPYLGGLPDLLVTPRLETPRSSVRAGSVGIAGSQTGIYPVESPGGWQIIGYTPTRLFDPFREPPALLSAGDQVRFIPQICQEIK
jgi:inhibitor of KinA